MEKEEGSGAIDHEKRIIWKYFENPDLLKRDVESHNEMLHKLNEKILRIIEVSPKTGTAKKDENGNFYDFKYLPDVATEELLKKVKSDNEKTLRQCFPDLYVFTDHLQKNGDEII